MKTTTGVRQSGAAGIYRSKMFIRRLGKRLRGRWGAKQARKKFGRAHEYTIELDALHEITRLTYWSSGKSFPRILLPAEVVTMSGALPYRDGYNPFVAGLTGGREALAAFYDGFQPKTLADCYRIAARDDLGADLPPYLFPWKYPVSATPRGERGLGPEHGFASFGPATPEKLSLEMQRLETVRSAIEKNGYQPDLHDDISGFFLRSGDDFRFVVRGGKHRAAVLAARGDSHIPVRMKQGWPRMIDRQSVADWPAVSTGKMSEAVALAFFDAHFATLAFEDLLES